jgi:hypothetical protein
MAVSASRDELSLSCSRLNESLIGNLECINCYQLREQNKTLTLELESAKAIISILQEEETILAGKQPTRDYPIQHKPLEYIQSIEDRPWIPVKHKTNKKNTTSHHKQVMETTIVLDNKFQTLDNLKVNQDCEPSVVNNTQVYQGKVARKIPTIINGTVRCNVKYAKYKKNTEHTRKVMLIGDSHLKEITTKVNQYLGTNVEVTGFIKPGATADQIVNSQIAAIECLGKQDLVVINGGSNNLENNPKRNTNVMIPLLKFVQNSTNTNVLIVTLPMRHDLPTNSLINHKIKSVNDHLIKRIRPFKHAHLLSMPTDRRYFTNHGQHLNKPGKECLAKELAYSINEVFRKTLTKGDQIYPLPWNENKIEPSFLYSDTNKKGNDLETQSEKLTKLDGLQELGKLDQTQRISNRQNKATIPRNTDFLWEK